MKKTLTLIGGMIFWAATAGLGLAQTEIPAGPQPTATVYPLQSSPVPTATVTPLPSASPSGTQPQTANTVAPSPSPSSSPS